MTSLSHTCFSNLQCYSPFQGQPHYWRLQDFLRYPSVVKLLALLLTALFKDLLEPLFLRLIRLLPLPANLLPNWLLLPTCLLHLPNWPLPRPPPSPESLPKERFKLAPSVLGRPPFDYFVLTLSLVLPRSCFTFSVPLSSTPSFVPVFTLSLLLSVCFCGR